MSSSSSSDASWEAYARLAEMTVMLFYGLPEVFVAKALLHAPRRHSNATGKLHPEYQLDEKISARLKLTQVYVRKILGTLEHDRIVIGLKPKAKEAAGEAGMSMATQSAPTADAVQAFWGFDFEELSDSVAYKLHAMERSLGEHAEKEIKFWRCPNCQLRISALEIDYNTLLNPSTGALGCPTMSLACLGVELQEEDDSLSDAKIEAHKAALRAQTDELRKALSDVAQLPAPLYIRPLDPEDAANGAAGAGLGPGRAGGAHRTRILWPMVGNVSISTVPSLDSASNSRRRWRSSSLSMSSVSSSTAAS